MYRLHMPERPVPVSPIALRLAGHVGQTALDRVAEGGVAILAELDQHVAAVRAELAACAERPVSEPDQRASSRLRRRSRRGRDASGGPRGGAESTRAAAAAAGTPGTGEATEATCPDVPFAATVLHTEKAVAVELLLHYACGFVEAAVSDGWLPEESADADDWVSLRLAAVCLLIRQTEAAAMVHPDLRPTA
jgi:Family of unknown function (DUF6401)